MLDMSKRKQDETSNPIHSQGKPQKQTSKRTPPTEAGGPDKRGQGDRVEKRSGGA